MGYTSAYKEVMRDYDKDRHKAKLLLEKRQEEVYKRIPRVKEIDDFLMTTGIKLSKIVLAGEENTQEQVLNFKKKIKELGDEKLEKLQREGYSDTYFTDIFRCKICNDTGYFGAQKCRCLRQKLLDKYYDLSNVRNIIQVENFDTFDFRYYDEEVDPARGYSPLVNIQTVYSSCMDFVGRFDAHFQNLLFYGDTGLGKTFLCNCIAKDLLDIGKTVLYVTAPRIFKKIEDFRFNRSEQDSPDDQLEMIFEVDLLIIDDLGSEFSTVVTNTELFNFVNSRILERRPTIISTNLSLNDFQNHYSDRIVSRFFGNYKMLKFFGDDIRSKKKMGSYSNRAR